MRWAGVGFHTDALSPLWKATTTFRLRSNTQQHALVWKLRPVRVHDRG